MSKLWVVGDSTLSSFEDKYYYPRYGYGTKLGEYLNDKVEVVNIALSGRSSLSFTKEENYETLMNNMESGDFLLMGFGHNDEKAEVDRFRTAVGDYKTEGSFANSLYVNYIEPARTAGVVPILATPIVRRKTEDNWSKVQLHITEDNGDFKGGDYPEAVRKLAADTHVALVDMTEITRKFYEELGVEETAYLHAWSCNNMVSVDNTHTNVWGAYVNAFFVMKTIKKLGIAGLSENVIDLANYMPYPAKENYLEANKDYKPVEFNSNLEASKLFKDVEGFKVSAFGDILAPADNKDFSCELEEKDGKPAIRMAVRENRGKISIVTDGILFAFKQIPAATKFKLTADITVNDYFSNDQVSFGLMVRDDVYVDMETADVLGDYVAAAPLFLTKKENATNCFARRSSEQVLGSKLRREIKKGMTVKACLFATEDGYGASFDDGDVITGGFDFKLTTVDPEHVYLGLFVSRNADVTFSNISLEM
ncbi:SGNH/GDSL hydrolase family protein [Lachnospira multipara]|uniref:hypothetical protein n=1 Tax=Lachnospira multipara TaxID=28051 RepID=UPI0003F72E73|nr:hypothetical protein [Lachnospira multipara]